MPFEITDDNEPIYLVRVKIGNEWVEERTSKGWTEQEALDRAHRILDGFLPAAMQGQYAPVDRKAQP